MQISGKRLGILFSGIATALLHLSLYPMLGMDPIVLNGLGYLTLLAAYFLPIDSLQQRHKFVWYALVGYTLLTFVLWIILGDKKFVLGFSSAAIGYYARLAEIFLLGCLWTDKPR